MTDLTLYNHAVKVHTLAVSTPCEMREYDLPQGTVSAYRTNKGETRVKINPNKLAGDLNGFSMFKVALDTIMGEIAGDDYNIVRIDIALDNAESTHYERFAKITRFLLAGFSVAYSIRNRYSTKDLIDVDHQASIAVKSRHFEVEYYDKFRESGGCDPARARLELRSMGDFRLDSLGSLVEQWQVRFDRALNALDTVIDVQNRYLVERYTERLGLDFVSVPEFIRRYKEYIYTHDQLKRLLMQLEKISDKQATDRAKKYAKRYKIELFTRHDMRQVVDKIMDELTVYFSR